MVRTIAVLNQKGGVGKTTIAVNLSYALSLKGRKVLLVDLDPQSNATLSLSARVAAQGDIYKVLSGQSTLTKSTCRVTASLDFVPSDIELSGIEHELSPQTLGLLKETFSDVAGYDYIIFDCAPSLGLLVLSCLAYVQEIIIPIQAEFFALSGLTHLVRTINKVRAGLNPSLKIGGIVFSMYDARKLMTREVEAEVLKYFSKEVFASKIRVNVKIAEAQSHGKTVLEYAAESNGSKDFLSLADEVIARELPVAPARVDDPAECAVHQA